MSGDELSGLGKQLVQGLAMLAKSVRIYSTDNAIFLKPLQALHEQLGRLATLSGRVELEVQESALLVNGQPAALDHGAQETLKALAQAFRAHRISGFACAGPVPLEDLRNFFALFVKDAKEDPPEDGLPDHKLQALRLRRPVAAAAAQASAAEVPDSPEAVRRRALNAYTRAVLWAELQLRCLHERRPEDVLAACPRVAQDLVDVSARVPSSLLPLLVNGEGPRALPHHLANTALIAVAFAERLGLARAQIRDLAVTGLSAEAILVRLPPELWSPVDPDRLPPEHQLLRAQAFAEESCRALFAKSSGHLDQLRALVVSQMHESHLVPVRDAAGAVAWQLRGDPLFVSRVLAMAAHYDALTAPSPEHPALAQDQALGAMWGPLRYRFDPELLWLFVRLMARIPLKVTPRAAGGAVDLPAAG